MKIKCICILPFDFNTCEKGGAGATGEPGDGGTWGPGASPGTRFQKKKRIFRRQKGRRGEGAAMAGDIRAFFGGGGGKLK